MRLTDCAKILTEILSNASFERLGLLSQQGKGLLCYLEDPKYLYQLRPPPDITAVITTPELARTLPPGLGVALSPNPKLTFLALHNHLAAAGFYGAHKPSRIAASARVHPSAVVAEEGVVLDEGVLVEPRAVLLPGVHCEPGVILRAGVVIGSEGFQFEPVRGGLLAVTHAGEVRICQGAEVQSGTVVDRAVFGGETVIGTGSRIDSQVFIAHDVRVGARCRVVAGAVLCGSALLEDDCWIGPGAVVSNGIRVGRGARVSIGAVVTQDVPSGETVTGNFALPHFRFLQNLRSIR